MDACTSETRAEVGHVFNVNSFGDANFPQFRFVDTPGQNEGESEDANHLVGMIDKLKEIKFVKLFVLTLNGSNMRFDESTRKIIQVFEDNLGAMFWKNTAIMFT